MSKKTLIIAEKPSVAADIARALGGFAKEQDYFESDEYVLSSAVGHLLELHAPEEYEVKRGKWSFAHLPVIPPHFALHPIERSEARLKLLSKLVKRKDVGALINACDAGREGELIFRYIVQHAGAKQPIQRLWLQSMTPAAIRDAFAHLRSDEAMQPLADAARCRSEADWLVGINGTRAMTAFNSKDGGFFLTTVGRVQTPTLAVVVDREDRIRKFVPRDYWEVRAQFGCRAGTYEGRWIDPKFKKPEDDAEARAERLWNRADADAIVAACRGQTGTATEESKPATQQSPLLFDLTSLQREANGRFGFSAKNTLALAQALYEKHKVLTYPRTDSRALPQDYIEVVKQTLQLMTGDGAAQSGRGRSKARSAAEAGAEGFAQYGGFAATILQNDWVRPNKRVFDDSKVSDHFAIVPTLQAPGTLSEPEWRIYDLVVRRFLSVFYPAAEYLVTTRFTEVQGHRFKTEGKVLVKAGWLEIHGRDAQSEQGSLVAIEAGEPIRTESIDAPALQTKPPARYTEATLLSAMEGAGKLVDDDELRAAMEGKGLGTPATRAAIIEGLLTERYLVRDGRELHPTAKAFQLMTLLRGLGVDELTAPELTGDWEQRLAMIEHGALDRATFMRDIATMTSRIVERAKSYESDTVPGDYATLRTPCPKCGAGVFEQPMAYVCEKSVGPARSCDFRSGRVILQQPIEPEQMRKLLTQGRTDLLRGFVSNRTRRKFAAFLLTKPDGTIGFEFEPRGTAASAEKDGEGTARKRPAARKTASRAKKTAEATE